MSLQEQLAAIRQERRAQFDAHRSAAQDTATPAAPSSGPPVVAVASESAVASVPSESAVATGIPASASTVSQPPAPATGSDVPAHPAKRSLPIDTIEAIRQLGPDATIGDLLADAPPRQKPKVAPAPQPMGLDTENAQVILEVKQAPPGTLRLISWNIDGINERDIQARTVQVCCELIDQAVSVVFLQEVVGLTLHIIQRLLGPLYHIVVPPRPEMPYFCVMLLQKDRVKVKSPVTMTSFESRMGRELLSLNVEIDGNAVFLSTAHLESTKSCAAERQKQFDISIKKLCSAPGFGVFGGDMNLRDDEAKRLMKATATVGVYADAWESAGKDAEARFTWDLQKNDNCTMDGAFKPRCRFDRMFFRGNYKCKKFALVGTERIPDAGCFPSDHFGMLIEWDLAEQQVAAPEVRPMKARAKKKATATEQAQCVVLDSE